MAGRVREEDGWSDASVGARFPHQERWRVRKAEETPVGFEDGTPRAVSAARRQFFANRLREPAVTPSEFGPTLSPSADAELLRRRE